MARIKYSRKGDTYMVGHNEDGEIAITCFMCGRTSYSPDDVEHRFCVQCGAHSRRQQEVEIEVARANGVPPRILGALLSDDEIREIEARASGDNPDTFHDLQQAQVDRRKLLHEVITMRILLSLDLEPEGR